MSDALFLEALSPGGSSDTTVAPAELPRQGRLVIGSAKDRASFHVEGQGVAPVHCTVGRLKSGGWALKDLGSDFGTMVNGKRVDAAKLSDGDEILIGSRKLRVFSAKSQAAGAAPKAEPRAEPAKAKPAASQAAASQPRAPQPRKTSAPASRPKTRELGGYRLERPLGRGAMGDVYLAVQTSLDRKVALKVLKADLAKDATFVRRFRDEARSAARLNHPNIVTVFDVGQEGDQHFLSMEYMDGSSLEEQLKKGGPIPWREALEILRDAAAGLVYAETNGIVHRDIKPENLMRNKDGVTKIADLGLAVQVEQEMVDSGDGKVFGTPHFLAPEVVRGASATSASDLYSLGATAYRILSGHTPFEGANTREILRSALQDEAPSLAARVPGLPAAMADTIHRLLAKKPEDRHPSAAILLAEIERLRQSGGQVGGAPPLQVKSGGIPKPLLIGGVVLAGAVVAMLALGGGDDPAPRTDDRFPTRSSGGNDDTSTAMGAESGSPRNGKTDDPNDVQIGAATPDGAIGSTGPQEGSGGAEASFEYRASLAYLELGDENLAPAQRVARLRALAEAFAGTDTATKALAEAEQIESKTASEALSEASSTAARTAAIEALRAAAALDTTPFLPGRAIQAMQALAPSQVDLARDLGLRQARNQIIDEAMKLGLARGRAAMAAADEAAAAGDFTGTRAPLEDFLTAASLPSTTDAPILGDEAVPSSVAEFRALAQAVSDRLLSMASSEDEFEENRLRKERDEVRSLIASGIERELTSFSMAAAASRLEKAAGMTSEEPLRSRLAERAADLAAADRALTALVMGWDSPGWRRQSVLDPRPGASGSVEIVGISGGALRIADGGDSQELPFSAWAGHTAELENLFLGRLNRDWTAEESRGIATLLTISATLETLGGLEAALGASAQRISPADPSVITAAFVEAREWATRAQDDLEAEIRGLMGQRTLLDLILEQERAARMLTEALIARDEGRWDASAERLERLLKERRDAWLVMMLSQGGSQ
ncbi:FHA domain-containing serine/threonine-protein kinase [Planctomycetes bacterium Poly30]|uniref:FHA domain-containing serine/threonine-protein kinase n=1 Tax=Saltatorellus ferox TaxID=2528018 RepID=UPI0011AA56F7